MVLNPFKIVSVLLLSIEVLAYSKVYGETALQVTHPFYLGINGGMGSTTWGFLVPVNDNKQTPITVSAPLDVIEGGGVYGGFMGYEFTPYFALEGGYRHYPKARVTYDELSYYNDVYESTFLESKSEIVNLMAKVMLTLPRTETRLFSSIGVAALHRKDIVTEQWRATPSFGAGLNANLDQHFMVEIGFNFTAGYAEAELNPARNFMPFLYSMVLGLAYRL